MTFSDFVGFIVDYINPYTGVPGIIFFLIFKNRMGKVSWYAFYILLASFLSDFAIILFVNYVYPNSYIVANSWYIINYVIVSTLFVELLPSKKRLVQLLLLIFYVGTIVSFVFFYSYLESNTFIRVFSSLAFTVLSVFTFIEVLKVEPTNKLKLYPIFWITTGLFLFSSISLFRNLFTNYLVFQKDITWELFSYISVFVVVFNIIKNFMFLYAFVLVYKGNPDYIHDPKPTTNA